MVLSVREFKHVSIWVLALALRGRFSRHSWFCVCGVCRVLGRTIPLPRHSMFGCARVRCFGRRFICGLFGRCVVLNEEIKANGFRVMFHLGLFPPVLCADGFDLRRWRGLLLFFFDMCQNRTEALVLGDCGVCVTRRWCGSKKLQGRATPFART